MSLEPLLDSFRWLVFLTKMRFYPVMCFKPFDATQRNQENAVIKIALLDYSDSESRQWGSRALSMLPAPRQVGGMEWGGAGSPVARIRNMDMKGRKETVK